VYAGTGSAGETPAPAYDAIRQKARAGERVTREDWYRLCIENGRTEAEASQASQELEDASDEYRAEIEAEASGVDVLSLLRSFRIE
jgi:hypothetical protein